MYKIITFFACCMISFAAISQFPRIVRYYENGETNGTYGSDTEQWTLGIVLNMYQDSTIDAYIPESYSFYTLWANLPYGVQDTMHGYWLEAELSDLVNVPEESPEAPQQFNTEVAADYAIEKVEFLDVNNTAIDPTNGSAHYVRVKFTNGQTVTQPYIGRK